MAQADFVDGQDGHPCRVAEAWSEEKLMILTAYLQRFAQACRGAGGWIGLDLFAGTGINWSATRKTEIPGSPLIALQAGQPGATEVLIAEKHRGARAALVDRVAEHQPRGVLFPGNANQLVGDMLARVPVRAPAFAFLDPEGSELHWPTVEAIAAHKRDAYDQGLAKGKIEQLILFPAAMGFVRLAPDHPHLVSRIFGHHRWKPIWEERWMGLITAEEARVRLLNLYADGLRGLGYRTVLERAIARREKWPMYDLVFATDHDAGERIMDAVFDKVRLRVSEELGQGTLFEMASERVKRA